MMTRGAFLQSSGSMLLASAAPVTIDWAFPGVVAAYACRVDAAAPFVSHNARTVMPAASVIKVLILLAVVAKMEAVGRAWSDELTIRRPEIVGDSERYEYASPGQTATFDALAAATIEQSDNTAANVLADWVGFARIGFTGDAAGLSQTELRRHFMDFATRGIGVDNTTSARDMGLLLLGIARGAVASGFAGASRAGCRAIVRLMLRQEDRETIPRGVRRSVPIANKTGELIGVRHDIAIVNVGSPSAYVLALLSCNLTNRSGAFARLIQLAARIDARAKLAALSS
jgi:beta-lactamase class A